MKLTTKVTGLDEAIDFITEEVERIENAAQSGFWEAGLKILRQAQIALRKSVVTGNLRASGYVRSQNDFERPMPTNLKPSMNMPLPSSPLPGIGIELGFTANYALWVHENMEGRSPKFLESVVVRNKQEIVDIVKRRTGGE